MRVAVRIANDVLPPVLLRLLRRVRRPAYGLFGSYSTYDEAAAASAGAGYEDPAIIEAVIGVQRARLASTGSTELGPRGLELQLALAHAQGQAAGGELRVLDFGGGAGGHYFDVVARRAQSGWPEEALRWYVCETSAMAVAAQSALATDELSFHESLSELESVPYDLVHVSGSLQYVPDARDTWTRLAAISHRWLALNRTPFVSSDTDAFTVQRAPVPVGGSATYPSRLLAERPWLERMSRTHDLVARWPVASDQPYVERVRGVRYEGMLLRRR